MENINSTENIVNYTLPLQKTKNKKKINVDKRINMKEIKLMNDTIHESFSYYEIVELLTESDVDKFITDNIYTNEIKIVPIAENKYCLYRFYNRDLDEYNMSINRKDRKIYMQVNSLNDSIIKIFKDSLIEGYELKLVCDDNIYGV